MGGLRGWINYFLIVATIKVLQLQRGADKKQSKIKFGGLSVTVVSKTYDSAKENAERPDLGGPSQSFAPKVFGSGEKLKRDASRG